MYTTIRILIETGGITRLPQILDHVPAPTLANDLKMTEADLLHLLSNPGTFNVQHIHAFGELLDVEMDVILTMVTDQFLEEL